MSGTPTITGITTIRTIRTISTTCAKCRYCAAATGPSGVRKLCRPSVQPLTAAAAPRSASRGPRHGDRRSSASPEGERTIAVPMTGLRPGNRRLLRRMPPPVSPLGRPRGRSVEHWPRRHTPAMRRNLHMLHRYMYFVNHFCRSCMYSVERGEATAPATLPVPSGRGTGVPGADRCHPGPPIRISRPCGAGASGSAERRAAAGS